MSTKRTKKGPGRPLIDPAEKKRQKKISMTDGQFNAALEIAERSGMTIHEFVQRAIERAVYQALVDEHTPATKPDKGKSSNSLGA